MIRLPRIAILADAANLERLDAALRELRAPELLMDLARQFPDEATILARGLRPMLKAALRGDEAGIETGLIEEERIERTADRAYWIPLKQELERLRHG